MTVWPRGIKLPPSESRFLSIPRPMECYNGWSQWGFTVETNLKSPPGSYGSGSGTTRKLWGALASPFGPIAAREQRAGRIEGGDEERLTRQKPHGDLRGESLCIPAHGEAAWCVRNDTVDGTREREPAAVGSATIPTLATPPMATTLRAPVFFLDTSGSCVVRAKPRSTRT